MADEHKKGPAHQIVDLRQQGPNPLSSTFNELVLKANRFVTRRDFAGSEDKDRPVAIYTRYSTALQKQTSIDRQVEIVTAYMRAAGYTQYILYSDPARSGRSMKGREGLARLREDCRNGVIRDVLVEDFDRWSRETYDAVELCEELDGHGVAFHSAAHGRALTKKEAIEAALNAEGDRDRRSLILNAGRLQHARFGGAHSGPFFGYQYAEGRGFLETHPEQAKTVRDAFEMAAAGMSYSAVARALTERGDVNPSKGRTWTRGMVSHMLSQEQYTGRVIFNRFKHTFDRKSGKTTTTPRHPDEVVIVPREQMRIVSDELFMKVHGKRDCGPSNGVRRPHKHFLTGSLRCDCPGMEGNGFVMSDTQMVCKSWASVSVCGGIRHSVMLPVIEGAVMATILDRLRSSVGSEKFAASVERSLRETAERRRAERAEAMDRIEDIRGQLDQLLDAELNKKRQRNFRPDTVARRTDKLNAELAELEERLETLVPLPEVLGAEERLACLSKTLEQLADRVPFIPATDSEAIVSNALSSLVPRVDVMRAGRNHGEMRLGIHLDITAFLHSEGGGRPVPGQAEVIYVDIEMPTARYARLREVAKRMIADGSHRIDDARWALVADRLPDVVRSRPDCEGLTMRDVVDALMLRLRTGLPILSAAFGEDEAMRRAMSRFVYAAGDQILLDTLRADDPDFVAGLHMSTVEAARARWKVGGDDWERRRGFAAKLHALNGRTALTDAQWAVSEPLIHYSVERSFKGTTGIPARPLLEAVLLALRTGAGWTSLPERFGDGRALLNSMRRLVRSGTWDRLIEAWKRDCPELVEGLDTRRLDNRLRGSSQWRGPAPRRSLHARNGGVGPASRRGRTRPATPPSRKGAAAASRKAANG